jgi:Sulfotransferase family
MFEPPPSSRTPSAVKIDTRTQSDRSEPVHQTPNGHSELARVGVIYVAGVSHTGSTLLGHILGELGETIYAGELRNTWQRGVLENRICTCDARFAECAFWQEVVERLPFAAEQEAEKLRGLHREAVRPSVGFPVRGTEMKLADQAAFAAPTEALYKAAANVAGVPQLVDSSKSSLYASFLRRLPAIDLRVVHIVRDPRATVYSHLRRQSFGYGETFKLSLWWLRSNIAIEKLAGTGVPYARIRYEDLVEDPAAALHHVTDGLGLSDSPLPVEGRVARLSEKHIISGNRARGEVGAITLRNDTEWRSGLPRRMQAIARLTTLPLLGRYGYGDD